MKRKMLDTLPRKLSPERTRTGGRLGPRPPGNGGQVGASGIGEAGDQLIGMRERSDTLLAPE